MVTNAIIALLASLTLHTHVLSQELAMPAAYVGDVDPRPEHDTPPMAETNATDKAANYKLGFSLEPMSTVLTVRVPERYVEESNRTGPITEAICGANSLAPSAYPSDCRIAIRFPSGSSGSCSAFVVDRWIMATAGHCVYDKGAGGFATAIDVYCGGGAVCGATTRPTTQARYMVTTQGWFDNTNSGFSNIYDAGVFVTQAPLPFVPYPYTQLSCPDRTAYTVTGYPGSSNGPACQASGYNTCTQLTSVGPGPCSQGPSGWYEPDIDTCGGHSGSSVYSVGGVVGILVAGNPGSASNPCRNYVTAIKDSGSGNGNGNGGGVYLRRLVEYAKQQASVSGHINLI
jgi:Trypsin